MIDQDKIAAQKLKLETNKVHIENMINNNVNDNQPNTVLTNALATISLVLQEEIDFLGRLVTVDEIPLRKFYLQVFLAQLKTRLEGQETAQIDLQWLQRVIQEEICFLDDLIHNER